MSIVHHFATDFSSSHTVEDESGQCDTITETGHIIMLHRDLILHYMQVLDIEKKYQ